MAITSPYVDPMHQDAALNSAINAINAVWLCPTVPQTYAAANTAKIVEMPVSPSDFTLAAGDTDGRKVRFAGKSGIANSQASVTCAVYVNTTTQIIHFINSITTTQVADQGQVTVNAYDVWEVGNPR